MTVPAEAFPVLGDGGIGGPGPPSAVQQSRDAYRRRRNRRSTGVASLSTAVVLVVVVAGVALSPGWPRTRSLFLDWGLAKDALPSILSGLWLNVQVLLISAVLTLLGWFFRK